MENVHKVLVSKVHKLFFFILWCQYECASVLHCYITLKMSVLVLKNKYDTYMSKTLI
jgi:hypothetical protein